MMLYPHDLFRRAKSVARIPDVWVALNLPGEPKRSCRSPFRDDRHASFSIWDEGRRFKDFATDDCGDVVDFLARCRGSSTREAAEWLLNRFGGESVIGVSAPTFYCGRKSLRKECRSVLIPAISIPSVNNLEQIAATRGWRGISGLQLAVQRGLLWTCFITDNGIRRHAWVITDESRRSAQLRRLDGRLWEHINAKAWTVRGSCASWPIGAVGIRGCQNILLCEGGPDFLAAHMIACFSGDADSLAAVCMPGAGISIHDDALTHFAGRRVRIFQHADDGGAKAVIRWSTQLRKIGAIVDYYRFERPMKDLADYFAANGPAPDTAARLLAGMEVAS